MKRALIALYKRLMVRKAFYHFHTRLLNVSLWGLGVLNSENVHLSGEHHFLEHLTDYIQGSSTPTVFDVGANVGSYAEQVVLLHPGARIYAFEPNPVSFLALQKQAQVYGYQAFNLGLSSSPGRITLYDHLDGRGSTHASVYRTVIESIQGGDSVAVDVEVTTLDLFAQQHDVSHVHLLKVDTEGHDLTVLQGAHDLIQAGAVDLIQFEFNEMNTVSKVFFRDFYALLPGYIFYRMLPDGLVPLKRSPTFLNEIFAFQNLVAVRHDLCNDTNR